MSYNFSILTSSGYPFYSKRITDEPAEISLSMRFFEFVHDEFSPEGNNEQSFELQAGLVSALYEFSRVLGFPIELLKYRSQQKDSFENDLVPITVPDSSDVLITVRSENFLISNHFEAKINMIYNNVILKHLPLGPEKRITDADENYILELLDDNMAKDKIKANLPALESLCRELIHEYEKYGLEGIAIASFDGNPLMTHNISQNDVRNLLRKIGEIPSAKEYQWKYRLVAQKGIFIINSGTGVALDKFFMPFYYLLITSDNAFLGDSPTTIYQRLNNILLE